MVVNVSRKVTGEEKEKKKKIIAYGTVLWHVCTDQEKKIICLFWWENNE